MLLMKLSIINEFEKIGEEGSEAILCWHQHTATFLSIILIDIVVIHCESVNHLEFLFLGYILLVPCNKVRNRFLFFVLMIPLTLIIALIKVTLFRRVNQMVVYPVTILSFFFPIQSFDAHDSKGPNVNESAFYHFFKALLFSNYLVCCLLSCLFFYFRILVIYVLGAISSHFMLHISWSPASFRR